MKFKNGKFSKIIVILCVLNITLFTIASLIIQAKTNMEISSTLTTAFFSFWGVEMLSLVGVKVSKKFTSTLGVENNNNDE